MKLVAESAADKVDGGTEPAEQRVSLKRGRLSDSTTDSANNRNDQLVDEIGTVEDDDGTVSVQFCGPEEDHRRTIYSRIKKGNYPGQRNKINSGGADAEYREPSGSRQKDVPLSSPEVGRSSLLQSRHQNVPVGVLVSEE